MKRLVKNGKIYLDGTAPCYEKEKLAFEKLEAIEDFEEENNTNALSCLKAIKVFKDILIKSNAVINFERHEVGKHIWYEMSIDFEDGSSYEICDNVSVAEYKAIMGAKL